MRSSIKAAVLGGGAREGIGGGGGGCLTVREMGRMMYAVWVPSLTWPGAGRQAGSLPPSPPPVHVDRPVHQAAHVYTFCPHKPL